MLEAFVFGRCSVFYLGKVKEGATTNFYCLYFTGVYPGVYGGKGDVEFFGYFFAGEVAFFFGNEAMDGSGDGLCDSLGYDLFEVAEGNWDDD